MIDHKTGQAFMNDESLRLALAEVWKALRKVV